MLCGLGAAAIWGGMYVVSKVVLEVFPPFSLLTIRLALGALVLGTILFLQRKKGFTREQFLSSFLVGFVGYGISLGFQFVGTKLSTASNGALVTSATPAFVLLFALYKEGRVLFKNKPRHLKITKIWDYIIQSNVCFFALNLYNEQTGWNHVAQNEEAQ